MRASIRAMLWRAIAGLMLHLLPNILFAETTPPEQHVFLVDVSGSMKTKPRGVELSPIQVRQEKLREWFDALPDSTVTLMFFNTVLSRPQKSDLGNPDQRKEALEWVDKLSKEKAAWTDLWGCLKEALPIASDVARDNRPVALHVFTDGRHNKGPGSFEDAIKAFPNVQPRQIQKGGFGDFDLAFNSSLAAVLPNTPPTPLHEDRKAPPSPPAGGSDRIVAFEIQEPRIVSDKQFVHFVNKTLPPANSYTWTIRRSPSRTDPTKTDGKSEPDRPTPVPSNGSERSVVEPGEVHWSEKDWLYQFKNSGTDSQTYSVHLVANYDRETVAAAPVTVLVQGASSAWAEVLSEKDDAVAKQRSDKHWYDNGALIAGLFTIGGSVIGAYIIRGRRREHGNGPGPTNAIRRSKIGVIILFGVTAIFLAATIFLARESFRASVKEKAAVAAKAAEIAKRDQATHEISAQLLQPRPSGETPTVAVVNAPSNPPATEAALPTALPQSTLSIFVTAVTILALGALTVGLLRRKEGRPLSHPFGRSLMEQLREIEQLGREGIIPQDQARAFKDVILERLRKQHGIPPAVTPSKVERKS